MKTVLLPFLATLVMISCTRKSDQIIAAKPNILVIITDDHAYQAISAYDSSLIRTPNIDRLATEGMLFHKAFVSNSICSPSRAVILTGKFSHLNSVRDNLDTFDIAQVTFPKILQQNNYETAIYGKWHLKSEPQGFDFWEVLPDQGNYYDPEFLTKDGTIQDDGYVTDIITDKAITYLDSLRDVNKPFMLMYNHKAPHRQWWPAMEDLENWKAQKIPVAESLFDDYANRGSAAREAEMRIFDHMALSMDNKIAPEVLEKLNYEEFMDWYESSYIARFNRLSEAEKAQWTKVYGPINEDFRENQPRGKALTLWKYQRYLEDYLGTIRSVDRNIGTVLDYLDSSGLAENTVVIYTSDQGFYLGEHGWFDKRFMYEESFRTPLLIRWPEKIRPGSQSSHLVQNIDLAPTILEATGCIVPEDVQGMSLLPIFSETQNDWRAELYYHYYEFPGIHMVKRHYGIRTERYKLIHFYYDIDEWELYDLENDPKEMNNVFADPDYTGVREELTQKLIQLRAHYKDSVELDQGFIKSDLARLESLGWL